MKECRELLFRLCAAPGTPGDETAAAQTALRELSRYGKAEIDRMGSVVCRMGKPGAKTRLLLDAHLDQVGLIVTAVDEDGFLRVDRCGGADRRVLPGSPVVIYGRETLTGIVCSTPPHLSEGGQDKVVSVDKMAVDAGLSREEAEKLVCPGDRIVVYAEPKQLLGSRVTAAGLDDRCGVAALIRCAQLLSETPLSCELVLLCSGREEVGGQGAQTAAYAAAPTQALAVDVSFARQPGLPESIHAQLGSGPMIGVAPILDRAMTEKLIAFAKKLELPHTLEIMNGKTGTNSDEISVTRAGVPCALVSIPLRYMHTQVEVIDLLDVERVARLLAAYVRGVE